MQQLLAFEAILKGASGLLLLLAPLLLGKIAGLPGSESGFWPRMLGALLLGMAGACIIEARMPGSKGLALGGLVLINLVSAAAIVVMLAFEAGAPTERGRIGLGATAALLIVLGLIEIAYV